MSDIDLKQLVIYKINPETGVSSHFDKGHYSDRGDRGKYINVLPSSNTLDKYRKLLMMLSAYGCKKILIYNILYFKDPHSIISKTKTIDGYTNNCCLYYTSHIEELKQLIGDSYIEECEKMISDFSNSGKRFLSLNEMDKLCVKNLKSIRRLSIRNDYKTTNTEQNNKCSQIKYSNSNLPSISDIRNILISLDSICNINTPYYKNLSELYQKELDIKNKIMNCHNEKLCSKYYSELKAIWLDIDNANKDRDSCNVYKAIKDLQDMNIQKHIQNWLEVYYQM